MACVWTEHSVMRPAIAKPNYDSDRLFVEGATYKRGDLQGKNSRFESNFILQAIFQEKNLLMSL